ncbi:MAG: PKD domain-containing protein [Bacteroidales bacterium]
MKKRDKISNIVVIVIFLANLTVNAQDWSWPVSPGNQQKNMIGTVGEFRDDDSDARFHRGNDITGDNYNVYAINSGTVNITFTNNCWSSFININGVIYLHVNPDPSLINGQTTVNPGDLIGTMFTTGGCNYHVHLQQADVNYLHGLLIPFVDNTSPTIHEYSFWTNGYDYTNQTTELDDIVSINTVDYHIIYNKIDIIVRANDTQVNSNGNSTGIGGVAPYSISYEIFNSSNESVDGPVQNITFTEYPNNNNANFVFGPNSTMQNAFWIITGHPFDTPHDRYWNTGLREGVTQTWPPTPNIMLDARYNGESHYPDGIYYIDLSVSDVDQNCAPNNTTTSSVRTIIDNFLPHIKKVEIWKNSITGDKIYEREWVWNGSNLNLSNNSYSGTVAPDGNIYVKITTSEPVQNITVNLFNNNYSFNVISNSDNLVWERTIPQNSTTGEHTLIISGQDLAGNNLSGNPSILAVHQADGSWMPTPIVGIDQWHDIYIANETLSANFTASPNPVIRGNYVVFTNTSTGNATSWEWTFEGGEPGVIASEDPPPEGIYYSSDLTPGTYIATLTISNETSSDTYSMEISVIEDNNSLVADFTSNIQSITGGNSINFADLSTGSPNSWQWIVNPSNIIFINGTNQYSQNPIIYFPQYGYGSYTISLTVTNESGSDTETKPDYITVTELPFTVDFTPLNSQIEKNHYVEFEDASEGEIMSWEWVFEGGSPNSSTIQNPGFVTYSTPGIFDVSLTVSDGVYTGNKQGIVEVCSDDFLIVHMFAPTNTWSYSPVILSCEVLDLCGSNNYHYYWYSNNQVITSSYDPEITWSFTPGQFTLKVGVLDYSSGSTFYSNPVTIFVTDPPPVTSCFYLNGYTIQKGEQFKLYDCSQPVNPFPNFEDSWKIHWECGDPNNFTMLYNPWTYVAHTYDEIGEYTIGMTYIYGGSDWSTKNVDVVDCNNGLLQLCNFNNLTTDWNFPIVGQQIIVGGNCPPGIVPEIPPEVKIKFYAPEGIRFLDGFHVTSDENSYFSATPTCPVNNFGDNLKDQLEELSAENFDYKNENKNNNVLNVNHSANNNQFYQIFPNPNQGVFEIHFSYLTEIFKINIFNEIGNLIISEDNVNSENQIVDLSNYPKGLYFVKISTSVQVYVEKIIKQ